MNLWPLSFATFASLWFGAAIQKRWAPLVEHVAVAKALTFCLAALCRQTAGIGQPSCNQTRYLVNAGFELPQASSFVDFSADSGKKSFNMLKKSRSARPRA